MTQKDHYLSTDSGVGLYLAIPQLPADRQGMWKQGHATASASPCILGPKLLPLTSLPLSGTLQRTQKRLSAPLFLLMWLSCLSKRQLGAALILTTSLCLTDSVYGCMYTCMYIFVWQHTLIRVCVHDIYAFLCVQIMQLFVLMALIVFSWYFAICSSVILKKTLHLFVSL